MPAALVGVGLLAMGLHPKLLLAGGPRDGAMMTLLVRFLFLKCRALLVVWPRARTVREIIGAGMKLLWELMCMRMLPVMSILTVAPPVGLDSVRALELRHSGLAMLVPPWHLVTVRETVTTRVLPNEAPRDDLWRLEALKTICRLGILGLGMRLQHPLTILLIPTRLVGAVGRFVPPVITSLPRYAPRCSG